MRSFIKIILPTSAFLLPVIIVSAAFADSTKGVSTSGTTDMNDDVVILIIYVLLALGFSFLCSVAEAVILSITPSYIEGLKKKRPEHAAALKRLKQDKVDRALAAILTLNTIAHTVGAIVAGAKATIIFGSSWFGLFSAGMTLMILFFSEIVPKTIGAIYWSKLTRPIAFFVNMLIVLLYPIVWLSERVTRLIAHGKNLPVFSRDEFIAMARFGEYTGHIQKKESRIIRNLFRFESLKVTDIMTPRTVISALSEEMSILKALKCVTQAPFSRLPLYKRNIDDITGFVLKDDVLIFNAQGRGDEKLKSLKRDILAIPETISLSVLLEYFLKNRQQIAIVVDEHGGTRGLVTLEDLIETLMGMEIMDETDNVEDMRVLARKQWIERARALGAEVEIAEQCNAERDTSPNADK
jgi:CBS domain containing-hemolysin-like protein